MSKIPLFCLSVIASLAFSACSSTNDLTMKTKPEAGDATATLTNDLTMKTKPESGDTIATFQTNYGEIKMFFYEKKAPETSKNFIELANQGKFNDTIFHRVIDNFMIQGGDFENRNGTGGYSYKGPDTVIQDEFGPGLTHLRGAVSMANSGKNTGGSQFFIVQASEGTSFLDGKHAIFGFVYEGMGTVDKIAKVKKGGMENSTPLEDVTLEKVEIAKFE